MDNRKFIISGSTGWLGLEALGQLENFGISKENLYLLSSKQGLIKPQNKIYETFTTFDPSINFKDCCYCDFAFLTKEKVNLLGEKTISKKISD